MSNSPANSPLDPTSATKSSAASAPLSPSDEAPIAASPTGRRPRLRAAGEGAARRADPRLRPFLVCAGALGLGAALAPLLLKPTIAPISTTGQAPPEIALALEDTLVVTPAMPPGVLLRGRLRLVAGDTDSLGRARAGGQVARHLVENGARVERGDAIVQISSGQSRRVAPVSERRQNRAEQGQIAATDAQNALAQKISTAQTRLLAAQERVARAQTQVGVARDVVRRLQNGERVASSQLPASLRPAAPARVRPQRTKRRRRAAARLEAGAQSAARQAQAAREAAQESARALRSAQGALTDAQNAAREAAERAGNAATTVTEVEARFDAKKASGSDVETARSAQKEAQIAVNSADKALIFAKTEVGKREKNAATAQSAAKSSAEQAARALASTRLEIGSGEAEAETAAPESGTDSGAEGTPAASSVSLERAIQFAGAALDESRRASREAERIHDEIEGYQGQVTRSNSRIEAATQDLAKAQQGVMDSVPRPRFTNCYAPSSGILTWISRLAREVNEGDPVFGIARTQRIVARFEDKSGLWRAIQPGATLTAYVMNAPAPSPIPGASASGASVPGALASGASKPAGEAAPTPVVTPAEGAKIGAEIGAGRATTLKMSEVQAPPAAGDAAKLSGDIVASGAGSNDLSGSEGAEILVSMPRPGQKPSISVPMSALLTRGNSRYVGVLVPLAAAAAPKTVATPTAENPATEPASTGLAATPTPAAPGERFWLRWTRVEVGRSDGLRQEITAGLVAGARIISLPEDLEAMGFVPATENNPAVWDAKSATSNGNATSQTPPEAQVLVRLTAELA